MVTIATLRKLALSFPEVTEEPHFEKTSFRFKKKIFATYDEKNRTTCVKLSKEDQGILCSARKDQIYPVNNKWGNQGWTLIEMEQVDKNIFNDALTSAYHEVGPTRSRGKSNQNELKRKPSKRN